MFIVTRRRNILTAIVAVVAVAFLIGGVIVTDAAVVMKGKTVRRLPIYSVATDQQVVALSFDASWGASRTLKILDVLREHEAVATFFAVGFWAEKYPDELRSLAESGIMEIGTHSNTHPHMSKLSRRQIDNELEVSMDVIKRVAGVDVNLFRAPFGEYTDTLIQAAESKGLMTIQWDVDTLDWKGLSAKEIAERVLSKAVNGSIVLMHNDGEHTLEALPLIITGLRNKGFTFSKIGDMIYRENYTIDHTGRQIRS